MISFEKILLRPSWQCRNSEKLQRSHWNRSGPGAEFISAHTLYRLAILAVSSPSLWVVVDGHVDLIGGRSVHRSIEYFGLIGPRMPKAVWMCLSIPASVAAPGVQMATACIAPGRLGPGRRSLP
ncbi:MAG: hypothetical protein CBC48_17285 [bacterium TMED88]|nr:hypothetical protein [Deltaproteobacteria bacterium]OUV24707.1 MAG: hypothetical protein CBC48_17285 [bacterium TMED88]